MNMTGTAYVTTTAQWQKQKAINSKGKAKKQKSFEQFRYEKLNNLWDNSLKKREEVVMEG